MADVAEERHHFSFLGVLELFGLLNRQRRERGSDREESEVMVRERPPCVCSARSRRRSSRSSRPSRVPRYPYPCIPLVSPFPEWLDITQ